jgi:hypothetical protein
MKQNPIFILMTGFWCSSAVIADATLVEVTNQTGDSLAIHRLSDGEIWASFALTDLIVDSFADHELIIMQVDKNKPIKLDHQKRCGGAARPAQQIDYLVDTTANDTIWSLSSPNKNKTDTLALLGMETDHFHHMRSDRRPEVVDFALQGELAHKTLWQQFKQGNTVMFHYTTTVGESRQAKFDLKTLQQGY